MLLVADVVDHRRLMNQDEQVLFGIDKLNVARSQIPAVTHVDYSARIQTVHADANPRYHRLLSTFKERTGCPVLVNTSFNVRRADRVHAGGRVPLLHGHRDRGAVPGQLYAPQRAPGPSQKARLQGVSEVIQAATRLWPDRFIAG